MQAQRKIADPVRPRTAAEAEGWAPSTAPGAVSERSSPAHLMLRDLAARLAEEPLPADAVALPAERKWPVPARLGTILLLGALCWAGLIVAITQVF